MHSSADTADLVRRAQAGEPRAFEELVRRHFRAAFAVALAVLRNPVDAEDVAQDAFVAALQHLSACRVPERFAGWLVTMVRNRALNVEKSRRIASSAANELCPEDPVCSTSPETVTLRARLLAALERITPAQREVVLLHDLEGWAHAEIGEALGISEIMSRQHLFQARRSMRAFLTGQKVKEATDVTS